MRDITLVMIRHSKSCANHLREIAGTHDRAHPLVAASQRLSDPALSAHGAAMARAYGPRLQEILTTRGVDSSAKTTLIGSSGLRRARQTAEILFPSVTGVTHLPHIKEFGNIPENTPARLKRCRPDFRAFLRHLHELPATIDTVICVAHGSFLRSEVWPAVAPGRVPPRRFGNLDALVTRAGLTADGRLLNPHTTDLPWRGLRLKGDDRCSRHIERLVERHRKTARRNRMGHRKRKTQRGGAATAMPLAWYQQGAQFQGTTADPTGVGLAGSSAAWARSALQAGGKRRRRTQRRRGFQAQRGGFAPSVMGAGFADMGMRLLPAAAYMGYNQLQHFKQRRKTRRHR
jgi:broad specificity phosphatase PhoE